MTYDFHLHTLGWKSFQDLAIAVAEECLQRPVQQFLSSNDAGRDGAFVGRWDGPTNNGQSTIQCKFTSLRHEHLTLSHLADEIGKVQHLSSKGLADDYIILTNHPISGATDIAIREAFREAGAGNCRVFGKDWITAQIQQSSRLRMMVPRLYGLGDLGNILDGRAYEQASMILSAMGNDLQRLVVTEAHRKSVKAITEHNFVLLLGAPASGKSTIGASLAVGAADIWQSLTIRATSPADLLAHINPNERQFFWVDDAWGSTQYQGHSIEQWNQTLPLMQGAIQRGSQFLLTSRDYIWKSAQRDLKTQALPLIERSKVIINVEALTTGEKAQILYNHLRLGDQPKSFRSAVKTILPQVVESSFFLPESARRLGTQFFTQRLQPRANLILDFFQHPSEFLLETIRSLSFEVRAAIALVFLSGGRIRSPIPDCHELKLATTIFGTNPASVRQALTALNGSLLLLAHDEEGRYWTYKHPTVGDAFAELIAADPELVEVYLRGAKAEFILREVVCVGVTLPGAPVCVPKRLYSLLLSRIQNEQSYQLVRFISYRADRDFSALVLSARPDLLNRFSILFSPLSEDSDAKLLVRLHELGLLPEDLRLKFCVRVKQAVEKDADASFLEGEGFRGVFSEEEMSDLLREAQTHVLERIPDHIQRIRDTWERQYDPEQHFESFERSIATFATEIATQSKVEALRAQTSTRVKAAINEMLPDYEPPETVAAPITSEDLSANPLAQIFRDVDA